MIGKGPSTPTTFISFLAIMLMASVVGQPYLTDRDLDEIEYGSKGNLYDIFRRRLQGFVHDLYSGDVNEGLRFLYNASMKANANKACAIEPEPETEQMKRIHEDLNEDHELTRQCLIRQINKMIHEAPGADKMSTSELEETVIGVLKETENERSALSDVLFDAYKQRLNEMSEDEMAAEEREQHAYESRLKKDQRNLSANERQTQISVDRSQGQRIWPENNMQRQEYQHTANLLGHRTGCIKSVFQDKGVDQFGKPYSKVNRRDIGEDKINSSGDSRTLNDDLIESSARGLNMTTDNLIRKVISMTDETIAKTPGLCGALQETLQSDLQTLKRLTKQAKARSLEPQDVALQCGDSSKDDVDEGVSVANVTVAVILDKVLSQLERIQCDKDESKAKGPQDGDPCDVAGFWNSYTLGLQLDIRAKSTERDLAPAEGQNKLLSITIHECVPPRSHPLMNFDWLFMGSTIKQLGGPFFIYGQNRMENRIGTFVGYCRTCNKIDTLFGAWTFLNPSRDCQDITASTDFRRDMLRRYKMDEKRRERFKELLYRKSKVSQEKCNVS